MPTCASQDCCCQCPCPCGRPLLAHISAEGPQTLTGRSGSISCDVTVPFPGSWCAQGFVCDPHESLFPPVLWKFCNQILLSFQVRFPGDSQSLCWIPKLGSLMWGLEPSKQCENFFGIICSSVCGSPSLWVWDFILM